jgi:mRNA interferase MazF
LPAEKYGLENESIALCHQIRTIDKKRLSKEYGHITAKIIQEEVVDSICFQSGINKK